MVHSAAPTKPLYLLGFSPLLATETWCSSPTRPPTNARAHTHAQHTTNNNNLQLTTWNRTADMCTYVMTIQTTPLQALSDFDFLANVRVGTHYSRTRPDNVVPRMASGRKPPFTNAGVRTPPSQDVPLPPFSGALEPPTATGLPLSVVQMSTVLSHLRARVYAVKNIYQQCVMDASQPAASPDRPRTLVTMVTAWCH